jgi:hypothetical protein
MGFREMISGLLGHLDRSPGLGALLGMGTAGAGAVSVFEIVQTTVGFLGLVVGLTLSSLLLLEKLGVLKFRPREIILREVDDEDEDYEDDEGE